MSTKINFQGAGKLYMGSGSITVSALAAGAEEDLTISDSNAVVGMVVSNPTLLNAAMESNLAITGAWVSAAGVISIRIRNTHASNSLTGGATTAYYSLLSV